MLAYSLVVFLVAIPLFKYNINSKYATYIAIGVLLLSCILTVQNLSLDLTNLTSFSSLLIIDSLSSFLECFIYISSAACLIFSKTIPTREYSIVLLFSVIGASIILSATDILTLYIGIELQSFGLYILAAIFYNIPRSVSAGLKYFLLGALASSTILLGIAVLYSYSGTTSLTELSILLSVGPSNYDFNILFGVSLIIVGLLFKLSAAPFHSWALEVYDDTPTIITTYLIVVPKIAYICVLIRLIENFSTIDTATLFYISACLSLLIGSIIGISQTRIKRILTYSTISHVGFILLALSNPIIESNSTLLFYLVQYTLTNLATFITLIAISTNKDKTLISSLIGIGTNYPILAFTFTILLLSTAGVPPIVGFFGKYIVLYGLIIAQSYILAVLAVFASVISAVYYLGTIATIYFYPGLSGEVQDGHLKKLTFGPTQAYLIAVLTLFVISFSLFPNLFLNCTELLAIYI